MPSLIEVAKKNPFNKPVVADGMVEFGSNEYYAKCAVGGAISCGLTHTMIVPLDLVKCRMQVDKVKYPNLGTGFKVKHLQETPSLMFPRFLEFSGALLKT